MTSTTVAPLVARVAELRETAALHKRAVSHHRRRARATMQELAALETRLKAMGITMEITQSEGGHSE